MGAYTVHKVEGSGFHPNGDFRPTVRFELRHEAEDGVVAAKTANYFTAALSSRQQAGYRLQMSKLVKKFDAYLERTGKRWELEQKEIADVKRARAKRDARIAHLSKNLPLWQAELEQLIKEAQG